MIAGDLWFRPPQSKTLGTPINWRLPEKLFERPFFIFVENTCGCVLGPWPWPRALLSLASKGSILEKVCPRKGCPWPQIFLCPWPWPRALCPRLHLCKLTVLSLSFLRPFVPNISVRYNSSDFPLERLFPSWKFCQDCQLKTKC